MGYEDLEQTVIDDQEIQASGDVETKWVELREQAAAPSSPTDKVSALMYALTDHKVYLKLSDGTIINIATASSVPRMHFDSRQVAPSDETLRVFRALAAGKVVAACVDWIVAPTDPEVLTIDVVVIPIAGGPARSVLTAPMTLEHDTTVPYTLSVDPGVASDYLVGDIVAVVRSGYAPGGGPTLSGTCVDIEVE